MNGIDTGRTLLRHTLATVAYRGGQAIRDVPDGFATFSAGGAARTPIEILAHVNDLYDWAISIAQGAQRWNNSTPQSWEAESARFFEGLSRIDAYLASDRPLGAQQRRLARPQRIVEVQGNCPYGPCSVLPHSEISQKYW